MATPDPRPTDAQIVGDAQQRAPNTAPRPRVTVHLKRPTSTSVVVHIGGEVDTHTAARLRELLAQRLSSTAKTVIIDLSQLSFLGVAGLELLLDARRRALSRDVTLRLVTGPICLRRALIAGGLAETFPTYPTLHDAEADLTGRPRQTRLHAVAS